MEVKCKTKDTLPLSEITEFQGTLKERDQSDYEKIEKSIKKHGFSFPFFIWKHDGINHCLDGHGRVGALKRMVAAGETIPELPVVYIDCKNEADAKELLLKLNSQYGKMTAESVKEFLGDLQINFEDLALPDGTLDLSDLKEPEKTVEDDDLPEEKEDETPDSKPGEIYQLGPHRLMCGDSTSAEDMAKLMDGTKADMIVTDPPYNVNLGQGGIIMTMEKRHRRTDGAFIAKFELTLFPRETLYIVKLFITLIKLIAEKFMRKKWKIKYLF